MTACLRRTLSLLGVVVLLHLLTTFWAVSASAHSTLVETDPSQGSQVDRAPSKVRLTFNEAVGVVEDSVRVLDQQGNRVDVAAARHDSSNSVVAVDLPGDLPKGSYSVVWHVVSADSHPVSGTFSFGVGVPAGTAPAPPQPDSLIQTLHWFAQVLWYAGASLLLGPAVVVALAWPQGQADARVRRTILAGAGVSAFAAVLGFVVQGPYGQGRGFADLADLALLGDTWGTTAAGPLLVLRVALAAALAVLLPQRPSRVVVAGAPLLLGAVSALGGHPGQEPPVVVNVAVDAVHFAAATTWLGGLATLALALLGASEATRREVLPRWSRLAMAAVGVLVVTGAYQAWRETRVLPALTQTDYGRLLIVKVAGLAVMLALAALGRNAVKAFVARTQAPGAVSLRESVAVESLIGVVVLAITAALVATPPARQAYAPPLSTTLTAISLDGVTISAVLDIEDTRPGLQTVHLYTYSTAGQVLPFIGADITVEERDRRLGPVRAPFAVAAPGHGIASTLVVPSAGTWTATVVIRTDQTTAYAATTTYPVRAP